MTDTSSTALLNWSVGLISTDYDLHEIRTTVREHLTSLGFRPVAFEDPEFPVQPHVHSHDACLLAVETMDIVVLVVDRRFGGPYRGVGPESITEMELRRALELRRPVIPCVSRKAWDARHKSKTEHKNIVEARGLSKEDARKLVTPEYVDGWGVLDFLDRIQHLPHDQYLIVFKDKADLVTQIGARLRQLSAFACRELVRAQLSWVQAQRSTSGLFASLGDVAGSYLHVEPPARIIWPGRRFRKVSPALRSLEEADASVVVMGMPGIGKSVSLARAFQHHAQKALAVHSFRLPFFVSLRGRGTSHHFEVHKFLEEAFREHLGRRMYPLLDLRDVKPVFYLDGLDENPIEPSQAELTRIAGSEMLRWPAVIAVRDAFARRNIDQCHSLASRFTGHCELLRWSRREALVYVDKCRRQIVSLDKMEWLRAYVRGAPVTDPIVESPLLLSLFLWLCTQPEWDILRHGEIGLASLFDMFLDRWARRELARFEASSHRDPRSDSLEQALQTAWEAAAWYVWQERRRAAYLSLAELKARVVDFAPTCGSVVDHPAFLGLLHMSERSKHVIGMVHEQFIEYLLARSFVGGCSGGPFPVREYLAHQLNADATRFVKSIWAKTAVGELKRSVAVLECIAFENREGEDVRHLMTAANCIYYISRIPVPSLAAGSLRGLLSNERRLYLRNGILFALVRLGDEAAEQDLYDSISNNPEANAINRGLHLEYFKDIVAVEGRVPPRDEGDDDWGQCLEGLVTHLEGKDARMLATKRIDLLTIRSFLETRQNLGPFRSDHYSRIRQSILWLESSRLLSERQRQLVLAEYRQLSRLLLQFGCS